MLNLKFCISMLAVPLTAFSINAAQSYPVRLQNPPEKVKVTQTYEESTGIYKIHVDENPFGTDVSLLPAIRLAELTEVLPEYAKTLAFEYKSTKASGPVKFYGYRMGAKGTLPIKADLDETISATDEWLTYRIPVSNYRNRVYQYGNVVVEGKAQYQDIIFTQFVNGTDFQIRNIRYEDEELPFADVTVTSGKEAIIEAENFNVSAIEGRSVDKRPAPNFDTPFINPTPGEITIYAFTSVEYLGQPTLEETAALMNRKYRDMEAAGFNLTEGGPYPAIDRCFLFDGLDEFNGYQANLYDGCNNLKMMIRHGVDDAEVIRRAMESPRLGGYIIKDEPFAADMPATRNKAARVMNIDDSRLIYGNLININFPAKPLTTNGPCLGFASYDDYIKTFVEDCGIGLISFDYYPVRNHSEREEPNEVNTILMPNFYENLEIASKLSRYYSKPWWGFVRSMSSEWKPNPPSVYMGSFRYPVPREDWMRVQAFSNLAYGAQGIQYWPYVCCEGSYDAPVKADGTLTPTYYYAKSINTEIKALNWVFYGAQLINAGHTNEETPVGCIRLTKSMLPNGIVDVKTSGKGMPVTILQNGDNLFMMAVNPDIWHNQTITVTTDKQVKLVNHDGTTTEIAAGVHDYDLPIGGYLLYLVDTNATPMDFSGRKPVYDNYRAESTNVPTTACAEASNGFYIANMGTHRWSNYSFVTPDDASRTITRDQALENWGEAYAYTFDVAEDMTVDISIGHSVPWSEYGRVAAIGAKPGLSYTIENEPELNWPKQYAASMILELDGETVMPAHKARPAVPEVFDETGAEFNAIIADRSRWISTEGDENLYFWPKAGGNDDVTPTYNAAPDYRSVELKAGTHRIVVRSNCYPWNFDAIRIAPANMSGIDSVNGDDITTLKATAVSGGILVETDTPFSIYNLAGVAVAAGQGSQLVDLNAGLYIVVADKTSVKVLVK